LTSIKLRIKYIVKFIKYCSDYGNMEKTALKNIGMILVLIVLITSLIIVVSAINETSQAEDNYTWTKALCDSSNFCQDYIISCKNKSIVSMSPITGAAVKFSSDWHDPRDEEMINKTC
jgi:hypothetical protein